MSIKFSKTPILMLAAFIWGSCQAASGLSDVPPWLKQGSFVVASGLAATGLLKAQKTEDKP